MQVIFTELQNGRHRSTLIFFGGGGGKYFFFLNFNITLLATWGCASDFFKDDTKIQNGHQRSTPNFFVGAKTPKSHDVEMCKWFF